MGLPSQPVTLSVEQIDALNKKLSTMRHDINNNLSLMLAAAEMVKYKPDFVSRMLETVTQQQPRISEALTRFSEEFEHTFGITRP